MGSEFQQDRTVSVGAPRPERTRKTKIWIGGKQFEMKLKRLDFKCNRMSLEVLSRGAGFKALWSLENGWSEGKSGSWKLLQTSGEKEEGIG